MEFGIKKLKSINTFVKKTYRMMKILLGMLLNEKKDIKLVMNIGQSSFTDGKMIQVSLPKMFYGVTDAEKMMALRAILGHEKQHIDSSDFDGFVGFQNEVADYFFNKYGFEKEYLFKISKGILNSVEDGRIEMILGNNFPGIIKDLKYLNGMMFKDCKLMDNPVSDILNAILLVSKTGIRTVGFNTHYSETPLISLMDEIEECVIRGVYSRTAKECIDECWEIVKLMEDLLVEALTQKQLEDAIKEMFSQMSNEPDWSTSEEKEYNGSQDSQSNEGEGSAGDNPVHYKKRKPSKKKVDDNEVGEDDSKQGTSVRESTKDGSTGDKSENLVSNSKETDETSEKKGSSSEMSSNDNDEEMDGESSESAGQSEEGGDVAGSENKSGSEEENDAQGTKDAQSSSNDCNEDDSLNSSNSGGSSNDEESKEGEKSGEATESEKVKESESSESEDGGDELKSGNDSKNNSTGDKCGEYDIDDDLNDIIRDGLEEFEGLDFEDDEPQNGRKGFSQADLDAINDKYIDYEKVDYREIFLGKPTEELPPIIKRAGRRFKDEINQIFENKTVMSQRGQKSGTFDASQLHRIGIKDYNVFAKKGHEVQGSYVGYVLEDGSGSMSGVKERNSNKACAILEEGLKDKMPLKMVTFTASGSGSATHIIMKDFEENDKKNYAYNYFIRRRSGAGNKDGFSIRVATKELSGRPEEEKILFILSDGLPSAYNDNTDGMNDVKSAVKEARKLGIHVICIMFGSEWERDNNLDKFKAMYEKNIISIAPERIPSMLTTVMKKILKH